MQGILKSNHERFCECLDDLKKTESAEESKLTEMEEELKAVFLRYQEKMKELKRLVLIYEEKQKYIRNEIKRIRKRSNNLINSKKIKNFNLGKAVVLIFVIAQNIFLSEGCLRADSINSFNIYTHNFSEK
jgi:predicted nuclease with TOPRIM domain